MEQPSKDTLVDRLLHYLNSTKLFFNLWLVSSSLWLLYKEVLTEEDFTGIALITTGVYFLSAAGAKLIHLNDEKPAQQRKFTSAEFLYFCFMFLVSFAILNFRLIGSDTYYTIVIWTYCLYNGVNVGQDFIRSRTKTQGILEGLISKQERMDEKES